LFIADESLYYQRTKKGFLYRLEQIRFDAPNPHILVDVPPALLPGGRRLQIKREIVPTSLATEVVVGEYFLSFAVAVPHKPSCLQRRALASIL
jgi:hypothetical protein